MPPAQGVAAVRQTHNGSQAGIAEVTHADNIANRTRFLDVLVIALNQTATYGAGVGDDKNHNSNINRNNDDQADGWSTTIANSRWYTSIANLQVTSLQVCIACRSVVTAHVRVDYGTPETLLLPPRKLSSKWKQRQRRRRSGADTQDHSRVSRRYKSEFSEGKSVLRGESGASHGTLSSVSSLSASSAARLLQNGVTGLDNGVGKQAGGVALSVKKSPCVPILRLHGVTWQRSPRSLKECDLVADVELLVFDAFGYNHLLEKMAWPPQLKRIVLGGCFARSVDSVSWPTSLEDITFRGKGFNHSIDLAKWPESLRRLTFGCGFNQPIENAVWPPYLEKLTFGWAFNQPVARVTWRGADKSLTHLEFGYRFNQPLGWKVRWPSGLQSLVFGNTFNQPLDQVRWPATLKSLTLGKGFDQPIHEINWPNSLQNLTILSTGAAFVESLPRVVRWPAGLSRLTMDMRVALGFKRLPSRVQICRVESVENGGAHAHNSP